MNARTLLFSPLGEWRASFLWRFVGLVIYEYVLLLGGNSFGRETFFAYGLQYALPAAFLLMGCGARLWALAIAAVLTIACAVPLLVRVVEWQIGEELAVFMALPAASVLLVATALADARSASRAGAGDFVRELRRQVDASHVTLFRITALVVLAFAVLHKLNYDFFDTEVSCASVLSSELGAWWKLPIADLTSRVRPIDVVLGEGLIVVLALTYPRLGILACALVIGVIGHRGATAFSMLTFALVCAFLYERDGATLKRGLRQCWLYIVLTVLVAAPLSAKYFVPNRLWYEFFLFEIVILLVALGAAYLMAADWRDVSARPAARRWESLKALLIPARRDDGFARVGKSGRAVLIAFGVLGIVNGMSPYLGLKYRLSFAMLSNLRVDDARWNSMVVPHWIYLWPHDPFVHVRHVEFDPQGEASLESLPPARAMHVGLFSPMSFKNRMKYVEYYAKQFDIDATYLGRDYSFRDALNDDAFEKWVADLPNGKMFQEGLSADGPQTCTH